MRTLSSSILKSKQFQKHLLTSQVHTKKPIIQLSNHLKLIAQKNGLVSLSGNQVNSQYQIFVMLSKNILKPNKFTNYNHKSTLYQSFINPKILDYSINEHKIWQQCPSYPYIKFLIPRSTHIIVEFSNSFKDRQNIKQQWKQFPAVIFQHQFNHLKGNNLFDLAEDVELLESVQNAKENVWKVREKFKSQFHKFKIKRDQEKTYIKESQINKKDIKVNENQNQDKNKQQLNKYEQQISYTKSKTLRDLVQYQIVDCL